MVSFHWLRTVLFNTLCDPMLLPDRPDDNEVALPVFARLPAPLLIDSNSFLLVGISMNGVTD